MNDQFPDSSSAHRAELAVLTREFADSLAARAGALRGALNTLGGGHSQEVVESFFCQAHSLQGTGAAFGAQEFVPAAVALAERGRQWMSQAAVSAESLVAAMHELELLEAGMAAYRRRLREDPA